MSEKDRNFQGRSQKNSEDSVKEAQKLYRDLRKRKVPVTLAALICAAVVGFGVWSGMRPDSGNTAPATSQTQTENKAQEEKQTESQAQTEKQADTQGQTDSQETQYTFRTKEQLEDHFERHGIEMGYEDEDAYVEGANRVISSPDALHKLEAEDGDDVYYIEESNEFVVVSKQGYIRTYFEPTDGLAYYERQ